ncbi:hypothetical protein BDZ94DRAFT_1315013 [Collybia nuda]|uniref:F-box domain-containing protein n=1 Tax=Collybia nuda TaxID=64659 RepID=A0A9P5XS51_9AGAR|nr:hypothetical protein BDZ94DRAFT_1315013 [Collybia nuda]
MDISPDLRHGRDLERKTVAEVPGDIPSLSTKKGMELAGKAERNILQQDTDPGRFPFELVGEILMWFCSSPAQLPAREISSDAFTFGHVCKTWRDVARARKDVWSSLRLNWAQCTSTLVAQESATYIAHTLGLSGNRPLNLQLFITAPQTSINSEALRIMLAPIFLQSGRWQKFLLTSSSEALEAITIIKNPFHIQLSTPILESFCIQSSTKLPNKDRDIQWSNTPFMNRLSAPMLRQAAFLDDAMMFIYPETLPWAQLAELDLLGLSVSVSLNEYAKILRHTDCMRKLRISVDRSLESEDPIVLDNLEILHIVEHGRPPCVPQYHTLMCGRLIELSVEYASNRMVIDSAEHTLRDILTSIHRLRRLYLQNVPLTEDGLIQTLNQCPYLTYLAVTNNESSDFNLPLTNQSLFQLTISQNCTLLPQLEEVFFESKACSDLHIERFVASRWDISNTTAGLRRLVYLSFGMVTEGRLQSQLRRYINCGLQVEIFESAPSDTKIEAAS